MTQIKSFFIKIIAQIKTFLNVLIKKMDSIKNFKQKEIK